MTFGVSMRQRGSCLLVSLLVLSQAVESESVVTRRQVGNNGGCPLNGYYYDQGEVYIFPGLPCNRTLRCHNNGWLSDVEGCTDMGDDACNPVGTTYVYNCTMYACTKLSQNGNIIYRSTVVFVQCQDYNDWCLNSGSQLSVRFPDGVVHHNCSCTVRHSDANYFCYV